MTPQARREANEQLLQEHGIPINPHLPMTEDTDAVTLRTKEEVWGRLVALWGVVGAAMLRQNAFFKEYFSPPERRALLSQDEAAFLFDDAPQEQDRIRFSWRLEAMMFLAWCAGLVDDPGMPAAPSSAEAILPLYPHDLGDAVMLREAIRLRHKEELDSGRT